MRPQSLDSEREFCLLYDALGQSGIALKKWTPKIRAGEVLLRGVRMKTKVRTQYTVECKREAWAMVASSEQTLPEVARALGLSRSALGRWRREQAAHGAQAFVGQGVARDEE